MGWLEEQLTRSNVQFAAGLAVIFHELLFTDGSRYYAWLVGGLLVGLKVAGIGDALVKRNGNGKPPQ